MAYQTILVHVDDSARAGERIRLASALASRSGGHLIGAAATGVARQLVRQLPAEAHDPTLALHLDFLRAQARTALAAFSASCSALGTPSFEARLLDDEAGAGLSLLAHAADVLVIDQSGADAAPGAAALVTQVIIDCARPVLLLPAGAPCATVGRRILLAWDGGRAAARAAQQALPLLKDAAQVSIAVCRPAAEAHAADDALAADPRPWLARHGVTATLAIHPVSTPWRLSRSHAVGEQLLALAREGGADLLVMGGYGHAPLRELLLGGVSRTVLATMTLPVLMAH